MAYGLHEVGLIACLALTIYLVMALASYQITDPGWSRSGTTEQIANLGGWLGAWIADVLLYLFGVLSYLLPLIVGYGGWLIHQARLGTTAFNWHRMGVRTLGVVLLVAGGAGLAALHFSGPSALPHELGGLLGAQLADVLVQGVSFLGATLFLLVLFLTGVTLFTGLSWLWLMDWVGRITLQVVDYLITRLGLRDYFIGRRSRLKREVAAKLERRKVETRVPPRIEPVLKAVVSSERAVKERQVPLFDASDNALPPLSLLDPPEAQQINLSDSALEAMSRQVEMKLMDFGVEVQVVAVHPGPVITRFEIQPAAGIKVSQITSLAKDLARSLSTTSVRVVEVIPGKSVIGLELPNEHRALVRLSETLQSREYEHAGSPLALALGKDIGGAPVVVDLGKMPHLLVAGTTGSGKSVAMNAMVLSILFNARPDEVRLIMIDPKMLELSVYQGIAHLLTPVVTDVREAANALNWCVAEMERRYRLMAALGVRNIAGLNRKIKEAADSGKPLVDPMAKPVEDVDPPLLQSMAYIVVIIDELADMMMVVGKKVENLIARLAQKARASGIHLILATQRPSVDVITGLIKANIPARIAFQVSAKVDSRTILDQMGAEQLLGQGDMLYLTPGGGIPTRVHGAFVADHEVHKVVAYLKQRGTPDYHEEVLQGTMEDATTLTGEEGDSGEADPLYDSALRIVTETRRASVSGIQRRLKIGYNRAARMIEEMERAGVVSPLQSNGSREVLAAAPPED
ncbi:MAG: DNA translocase FtsK 4TM domain-containing protein [Gammaproteobacteria bacterium]|nr:DNA translocase FtsK 4TM domain-containing protein [Gammaproteobacteria bacterium]